MNQAELLSRAETALLTSLSKETGWIKVHAGDALADLGNFAPARAAFEMEAHSMDENSCPFRIGVWRTLALTSVSEEDRDFWIGKIAAVFMSPTATDKSQAVESLAKVRAVLSGPIYDAVVAASKSTNVVDRILPYWALANHGDNKALVALSEALSADDAVVRLRAAFALRWLKPSDAQVIAALDARAKAEPQDSIAYPYVLSAAVRVGLLQYIPQLVHVLSTAAPNVQYEACQTLMHTSTARDYVDLFTSMMDAPGDSCIGASWALCRLLK
jgi:hypothetical protein